MMTIDEQVECEQAVLTSREFKAVLERHYCVSDTSLVMVDIWNHVWVTPFREDEKYGAGNYPNQSDGGDGLIRWTAEDRAIQSTDVVLWYTMGHTHLPRPEDYPVMPTAYIAVNDLHGEVFCRAMDGKGFKPRSNG